MPFPEHKYGNFKIQGVAKRIIEVNRIIARHLGGEEIIYCPDSAFPTSSIEEFAFEGNSLTEIKKRGIEKFGHPPKGIDEGRKYMFFIDNIHEDIGELTEWHDWEVYWKYNRGKGYELRNKPKNETNQKP